MKRLLGLLAAVVVGGWACEPLDPNGGGGGGGVTTFNRGFVFARADKNIYAADSSDYQSVIQLTTNGNNKHPSLNKAGNSVVFIHADGANTALQTVTTSSGTTPATVFSSDGTNINFKNPVFSPNGDLIAFNFDKSTTSFVGVVNVDGSGFRVLTPATASYGAPAFLPDGESVIAPSGTTSGNFTSIQRVTLAGTTSTVLSSVGGRVVNRVVVSPDGTVGAFDGTVSGSGSRIFAFSIAGGVGGNISQLTGHPGEENAEDTFPTFISNDDVAFHSNFGGNDHVYVISATPQATKSGGILTVPSALEPTYGPN